MSRQQGRAIDVVESAFRWFNQLGSRQVPLRRADIAQHFHANTRIQIDAVMKGVGIDGMHDRFAEMLDKLTRWHVPLPFARSLSEDDRAAANYHYLFKDKAGGTGTISIVAIWTVAEGKVLETVENATYEGASLELSSHL